jgi:hypothetical protein
LGRPQRVVALLLVFTSVMVIGNSVINPVFSQNYTSTTSLDIVTVSNRTMTITQIYRAISFTTYSSMITQVIVAFITSTTYITYTQVTFRSSTSTFAYSAPSIHSGPTGGTNGRSGSAIVSNTMQGSLILPLLATFLIIDALAKRNARKMKSS